MSKTPRSTVNNETQSPSAEEIESNGQADARFDPSALRLTQDFAASAGVKKLLTTVPVRKPTRQEYVRVHPDESYRLQTAVLELKEERETYLVDQSLWPELVGELTPKALFTTINRQGVVTLWPVRLPGEDGRIDEWNLSATEAAGMAVDKWIRVAANMSLGAYEIFEATGELPEPTWPEVPLPTLLKTAFRTRYIESMEHAVIKRLRGET